MLWSASKQAAERRDEGEGGVGGEEEGWDNPRVTTAVYLSLLVIAAWFIACPH